MRKFSKYALFPPTSPSRSLSLSLWEALPGATFRGIPKKFENFFEILKFFQKNIFQNFYHRRDGAQTPNYFSIFCNPISSGWKTFCTLRTLRIAHGDLRGLDLAFREASDYALSAPRPHRVSGIRLPSGFPVSESSLYHLRSISGARTRERAPAVGRDGGDPPKTMLFALSSPLEGRLLTKVFLRLVQNHFPPPSLQGLGQTDRFGGEEKNYFGPTSRDPARFWARIR